MPDSKDTGEKPWQQVYLARRKHTDDPLRQMPEVAARASSVHEGEIYVPLQAIRERLLSKEAVGAVARERFDYLSGYSGPRWEEAHESIRRQEEDKARMFLEAALDAAFSKEEG